MEMFACKLINKLALHYKKLIGKIQKITLFPRVDVTVTAHIIISNKFVRPPLQEMMMPFHQHVLRVH